MERKNQSLQEMARMMLNSVKLWAETINTYVLNRVSLSASTLKTPYEIWKRRKPNLKYFHTFGSKCYVTKDREHLGKFNPRSDEGVFIGYFENSRVYRIYNIRTQNIIESINVWIVNTNDFPSYPYEPKIHNLGEHIEYDQNIRKMVRHIQGVIVRQNCQCQVMRILYRIPEVFDLVEEDHELQNKRQPPVGIQKGLSTR